MKNIVIQKKHFVMIKKLLSSACVFVSCLLHEKEAALYVIKIKRIQMMQYILAIFNYGTCLVWRKLQ